MKKKRIPLQVPKEQTKFFAISCSDQLYKLAWSINSSLSMQLKETNGVEISDAVFPVQKDETSIPEASYLIIKNRIETAILLRELENIDYILKIQGKLNDDNIKQLVTSLKKLSSVTAVIPIDSDKIKKLALLHNL